MEKTDMDNQETKKDEERTFTQAELNAIVAGRVKEERAKFENYEELKEKAQKLDKIEEENKTELQRATDRANALQAEIDAYKTAEEERKLREKISSETGVPANLLKGNSEEDLRTQAQAILTFAKSDPKYPEVKKDGGEVHKPTITKAEILAIKSEKERLKAIQENIDLFD